MQWDGREEEGQKKGMGVGLKGVSLGQVTAFGRKKGSSSEVEIVQEVVYNRGNCASLA